MTYKKHLKKVISTSLIVLGIMSLSGIMMWKKTNGYHFPKKQILKTEKRTLFVFHTEITKTMEYKLTISDNDSITKYSYQNLNNKEKNMEFYYHKASEQLTLVFDKFILTDKIEYQNKKIHKLNFGYYKLKKSYDDGSGPLLFNTEYGILGIGNSYGPEFVYLPNSNLKLAKEIIDELYK